MAIFVNYYPNSYGDSLVAMFQGLNKTRANKIVFLNSKKRVWFKLLDFYQSTVEQKQSLLSTLNPRLIVSCHRQHQFDFGKDNTVISIVLDEFHWIGRRYRDVHINQLGKTLANPRLMQFQDKLSIEDLVVYDYKQWAKHNILDSDIKLPISTLRNHDAFKSFCNKYNLAFVPARVDEILCDINKYVL